MKMPLNIEKSHFRKEYVGYGLNSPYTIKGEHGWWSVTDNANGLGDGRRVFLGNFSTLSECSAAISADTDHHSRKQD